MRLVALDLGTTSACVVADECRPLVIDVWDCALKRGESGGMRFLRFRRMLGELLDDAPVRFVGYERPAGHFKSSPAASCIYGLIAELETACTERNIDYVPFNPSQVKKIALGKGGGEGTDKKAMLAAARARWPQLDVEDDNVADALFVLECLKEEVGARNP